MGTGDVPSEGFSLAPGGGGYAVWFEVSLVCESTWLQTGWHVDGVEGTVDSVIQERVADVAAGASFAGESVFAQAIRNRAATSTDVL